MAVIHFRICLSASRVRLRLTNDCRASSWQSNTFNVRRRLIGIERRSATILYERPSDNGISSARGLAF